MNAEALISAILANIGDPQRMMRDAKLVSVKGIKTIPEPLATAIKRRYIKIGRADMAAKVVGFVLRLAQQIEMQAKKQKIESEADRAKTGGQVAAEGQYKFANSAHVRRQTAFRSSIGKSKSFGGISEELMGRLDTILKEEMTVRGTGVVLMPESGQLMVDGKLAVGNHADIMKILVSMLSESEEGRRVLQEVVNKMADVIRSGELFRT